MSSGKSTSSSPKGSQNGSHSPLYSKNEKKNANPSGNSEEIPIKSTLKRAPEEGWWSRVEKEIPKTLSHIGTEVNPVKNNAIIRPIFVMGSFCFYEGMPNYQRAMATLNKVPKLRGNFLLRVMKGHLNVATFDEETREPLEKVILENGSFLATGFGKPFVWKNNQDWNLWGFKLRVPFLIKGEEWIQRLFIGESALPRHGLREVAQISDDCIVIFYDVIPLILTRIIAKHRGSFIINNEFQGRISLWTPMSPFHEKVNCQVCETSHSRHLKCAKEIVDKEGEGGIIKKLNNETDSRRKSPSLPVTITKLREQSHKRFIIPTESSTNQENQGTNLSLSQFPRLSNPNQRAPPSMKSANPRPSSTTPMEVDQSTNVRETALREGSSKEKSAPSRSNQPKSSLMTTKPRKESPSQTPATSSRLGSTSETPTIPQKDMMDFLEDIVAETDAERGVILIEDEDEISPDVSRPRFSSDPISGSKWSMTIHDTEGAWKILDGANFQCEWERTEDSLGKLKSELEKGQLKWESSFDADFLGHIIDRVVEELKLKPKSRLRKRVVSEETVEEKEPTPTGTKPLPVTKKPAKKKKKKSREEEKGKEEIEEEKDEEEKTKENDRDKSVPTGVPGKEKATFPFSEIPASNGFAVLGDLHQIEWGETVLTMDSARFPESSNVSSSSSSPPS